MYNKQKQEHRIAVCNFELKSVDEEAVVIKGVRCANFDGYASVFNNVDFDGDVVKAGAFKQTLNRRQDWPVLWQHDYKHPIGVNQTASEDNTGLKISGLITLDTPDGNNAWVMLKMGAIKGLSIGYQVVQHTIEKGVRYLTEIRMFEYSVVTFPANDLASVTAIKSHALGRVIEPVSINILQGCTKFQNLPLAPPETSWNVNAAIKRLYAFAEGDMEVYSKFFMFVEDDKKDDKSGYHYAYVDIVDGKPMVIPKALDAISNHPARSNPKLFPWAPNIVQKKVHAHIVTYQKKMGAETAR